jgi:hypothetical protein
MRISPLLMMSCLAAVAMTAAPRVQAFTAQPEGAAAVTGGAPLADPDDKLKTMFGSSGASGDNRTLRPGTAIGTPGNYQPGAVPGFGTTGYGATYDRNSGKGD